MTMTSFLPWLRVTFSPDDDGTGELHVSFQAGGFSGEGSAWFGSANLEALILAQAANLEISRHAPFVVIRLKVHSGVI